MAANVYAKQLLGLGHGHALWEPNPGKEYRQVEIGDVGFIQAGFFHRLFNILLPGHDPSQKWGVPEHYEPLRLPFPDYKWDRHPLHGHLHSTSVKVLSSSFSTDGGIVASGSARVSFECTKESGAALVLPEDAVRQDAHFGRWFREYGLRHYSSWVVFANEKLGFDLEVPDLILVTGRDLTTQWAMAAFAKSEFQGSVGAGVSVPGILAAEFEVRSGWRTDLTSGVQYRCGPQSSRFLEPERVEGSWTEVLTRRQNQCVFLRGYRIKERRFLVPKVIKAASKPADLDKDNRESGSESVVARCDCDSACSMEVQELAGSAKDVNLLDPILDHILNESAAQVAIAHDEDLWPYLNGLLPLSPETAVVTIDDNGVGRLLAKSGPIELRPPFRQPTSVESLESIARPMNTLTLQPYKATLTPVPRRAASALQPPWSMEGKGKPKVPHEPKKTRSLTAPISKIGAYLRQRSLRKAPLNPDFASSYAKRPQGRSEGDVRSYSGGSRGRTRATTLRAGVPHESVRTLATIADTEETGLPDEYRLDLPPPYELNIPEQYKYK